MGVSAFAFGAAVPSEAATATTNFNPIADAHVANTTPTTNFGTSTRPAVDGSPLAHTVMRFQVAGLSGTVTSAKLRLFVNNPSTDGPAISRSTGAWTESGVTWNNRPSPTGASLGDLGAVNTDSWVEYNLTSTITANGTYDFILTTSSADGMTFHSREGTQRPQLVVATSTTDPDPDPSPASSVDVTLTPAPGVSGSQRVNFAVPLATGQLYDPTKVRVLVGGVEIPAARRGLALHPDGSIRSVQIQVQTTVSAGKILQVRIGETPTTAALSLVEVSTTLTVADGSKGPRVWARLPAAWLSAIGVTGPQIPEAQTLGIAAGAWNNVCDYQNHTVTHFLSLAGSREVWLFDRGTVMYRGYARRGDLLTLESAYRETAIYRNGITGTGTATRIGIPTASDDLKYHYTQNLAIHYLLTGDNRFREAAENVAQRAAALWTSPGYSGGADFWTERHAGFALLAYVWADIVTDDHGTKFQELADNAVDAYIAIQAKYPPGWTDSAARCFAHQGSAAGEGSGWVCSPWMSAILADALDAYATERGGADAIAARAAIVKLGKIIARDGRDSTGKPFYMMGVGSAADEIDSYDEHWGEPAYLVAMAWHWGGRTDASLKTAAEAMLTGLKNKGSSPHMRSFNWQCRSVGAPWYLQ